MRTDKFGQIVLNEDDIIDIYLSDPDRRLKRVVTESKIVFPDVLEVKHLLDSKQHIDLDISIEEFDKMNQDAWHMPEQYKTMDIAQHVLDSCENQEELQRAGSELLLFQEKDMFMLLRYLKYLVDIMRQHNIIWGVGRGSSTSSFVLFLLGVHKINSMYYDLPIEEFIK
jgi:DNA polymerase III alpha subunit